MIVQIISDGMIEAEGQFKYNGKKWCLTYSGVTIYWISLSGHLEKSKILNANSLGEKNSMSRVCLILSLNHTIIC